MRGFNETKGPAAGRCHRGVLFFTVPSHQDSFLESTLETFACARCGNCCTVRGVVRLRPGEAERMARHLGFPVRWFAHLFTRVSDDRTCLVLAGKPEEACIFLDCDRTCLVHAVKPEQCRTFPLAWRYPGWDAVCPGRIPPASV